MSSFLGTGIAKMIYDRGGAGEVVIPLPHARDIRQEPVSEYIQNESELDTQRDSIFRGTHWRVEMVYHLYKEADPVTKYLVFATYKGTPVTLYLRDTGKPFSEQEDANTDALFILREMTPINLTSTDYKDGLLLTFESTVPADVRSVS
jgi:hypothetical protein